MTDDVLEQRAHTHGDFTEVAALSQRVKELWHAAPKWAACTSEQREALDAIAMKVARALCGDPTEADHWRDLVGYARLAAGEGPRESARYWQNVAVGYRAAIEPEPRTVFAQEPPGGSAVFIPPPGWTVAYAPRHTDDSEPWEGSLPLAGARGRSAVVRGSTQDAVIAHLKGVK